MAYIFLNLTYRQIKQVDGEKNKPHFQKVQANTIYRRQVETRTEINTFWEVTEQNGVTVVKAKNQTCNLSSLRRE